MFAAAIWDGCTNLFTDIFGEKPLFVFECKDGVYFASEAGALIKGFELKFEPSSSEQEEFLNLGYIRQPFTGYKNLISLSAACHLTIANGEIKNRSKYWMLPEPFIGKGRTTPISDGEIDIIRESWYSVQTPISDVRLVVSSC